MSIDERFFGTWKSEIIFNDYKKYTQEEFQKFGGYIKFTTNALDVEILNYSRTSLSAAGCDYIHTKEKLEVPLWANDDEEDEYYNMWLSKADWKILAYDTLKKKYAKIRKVKVFSSTSISFDMNCFNEYGVSGYQGEYNLIDDNNIECNMSYSASNDWNDDYNPYRLIFKRRKKFLGLF